MEITFLGVVFAVIIVLLAIGRPLYQAIAGGMVVTAGLFHIPVTVIVTKIASVIINWSSLSVLLSLYLITFLLAAALVLFVRFLIKRYLDEDRSGQQV